MNAPQTPRPREDALTLELLTAIEHQQDVTQRHLAHRLGVALGLANSYLKRCIRKGFIKVSQAPANRYLYYLTPHGFAEKSRLTAEYLSVSFDFYRRASTSIAEALQICESNGVQSLLFAGISELAEIASVRSHDFRLDPIGTFEPNTNLPIYLGKPVWNKPVEAPRFDAVLLTALTHPREMFALVLEFAQPQRVIVPEILRPLLSLHVDSVINYVAANTNA